MKACRESFDFRTHRLPHERRMPKRFASGNRGRVPPVFHTHRIQGGGVWYFCFMALDPRRTTGGGSFHTTNEIGKGSGG